MVASNMRDVAIQIEGHADERGTREYNISLSARRATNVRNFLISQGISANRACRPLPMARNVRHNCVTRKNVGHKIAVL